MAFQTNEFETPDIFQMTFLQFYIIYRYSINMRDGHNTYFTIGIYSNI